MNELGQWQNDIRVYDEKYETLYLKIKEHTNAAIKLVRGEATTPMLEKSAVELALCNQQLVEIQAMAGTIFRGANKFYELTKGAYKANLIKEKNIAEEAAEVEALALSIEEFTVMDQAAYNLDIANKRWESTNTMIHTLLVELGYGKAKNNSKNTSNVH